MEFDPPPPPTVNTAQPQATGVSWPWLRYTASRPLPCQTIDWSFSLTFIVRGDGCPAAVANGPTWPRLGWLNNIAAMPVLVGYYGGRSGGAPRNCSVGVPVEIGFDPKMVFRLPPPPPQCPQNCWGAGGWGRVFCKEWGVREGGGGPPEETLSCQRRQRRQTNSIAFGSAPRREVDSQPISP